MNIGTSANAVQAISSSSSSSKTAATKSPSATSGSFQSSMASAMQSNPPGSLFNFGAPHTPAETAKNQARAQAKTVAATSSTHAQVLSPFMDYKPQQSTGTSAKKSAASTPATATAVKSTGH